MHVALPKTRSDKLPASEQRLGFLAADREPTLGYVGGLLVTTARGRPLEFHYSTPVKPSPTHKILYGAELEPYILGELIGYHLMKQCTVEVSFIVTDQLHILSQRQSTSCPILCIAPGVEESTQQKGTASRAADLRSHSDFGDDVAALERWLQEVNPSLDLREPFVRVWEALREVLG
jgi:hypothetical protein